MSSKGPEHMMRDTMTIPTKASGFINIATIFVAGVFVGGCASTPSQWKSYHGPRRPLDEVAVLATETLGGSSGRWTSRKGPRIESIDGRNPRVSLISGPIADGHGPQEFLVLPGEHEVAVSLNLPVLGGQWHSENRITIPFKAAAGKSYRLRFITTWIGQHPNRELKWNAWIEEDNPIEEAASDK